MNPFDHKGGLNSYQSNSNMPTLKDGSDPGLGKKASAGGLTSNKVSQSNKLTKQEFSDDKSLIQNVPQFYFPKGDKPADLQKIRETEVKIEKMFADKKSYLVADFAEVCTEICEVPKIVKELLFEKIDVNKTGKIEK